MEWVGFADARDERFRDRRDEIDLLGRVQHVDIRLCEFFDYIVGRESIEELFADDLKDFGRVLLHWRYRRGELVVLLVVDFQISVRSFPEPCA